MFADLNGGVQVEQKLPGRIVAQDKTLCTMWNHFHTEAKG